jgi:hypothetical protein
MFGLGIAFGAGNSFWGKATGLPLRQIAFNLGAGTGNVIQTFASPTTASTMMAIGVDSNHDLLGGVVLDAPDNFQLYGLPAVGAPSVLETNAFPTDNENNNGTGSVDFGGNHVFALNSNNGILAMRILPPQTAPVILEQPDSQSVLAGSDVTFSVVADGFPALTYQWQFNGTKIVGAESADYALVNVQPGNSGNYSVVITNTAGRRVSSDALLTVNPWADVRFESISSLSGGRVRLEISGQLGQLLWIEQAEQLSNWLVLTNLIMSNSTVEFIDESGIGQPLRLYRAHQ